MKLLKYVNNILCLYVCVKIVSIVLCMYVYVKWYKNESLIRDYK